MIEYKKGNRQSGFPPKGLLFRGRKVTKTIMKPTIFFHGNTWQKPGDFIQICGAGFDSVKEIRLSPVPAGEGFGYIMDSLYNRLPRDWEIKGAKTPDNPKGRIYPEILQKSDNGFKFELPGNFREGIYDLDIDGEHVYINVPRIEELLGDEGGVTTPGGKLRIIGTNLAPKGETKVVMLTDDGIKELEVSKLFDNYSVEVIIPEDTKPGKYKVSVSNLFGNDTAWSMPFEFEVGPDPRSFWPKDVFDVKAFGAAGNSPAIPQDEYFSAALDAIAKNGGGVLYISEGLYYLEKTYEIPANTEIRGDGITKSVIMWRDLVWELDELPPYLFKCSSDVDFHDFTLGGSRMPELFKIGSPDAPAKNVYIRNMRIFVNAIAGEKPAGSVEYEKRCRMEIRGGGHGIDKSVFVINGDNVQICNNEMRSSGAPFQFGRKSHVRISNNYFTSNVRFWMPVGHCLSAVIEDNEIDGITLGISGEGIYYARNKIHSIIDNNREAFTTDMGRGDYNETIKTIDSTTFELNHDPVWADGERNNFGFFVISGKGMGQYRRIVESKGRIIKIDEPFLVPIDENSLISFSEVRDRFFMTKNTVYDAGHFQLFGVQINTVLDGNSSRQSAGFLGWSRNIYYTLMPNWYVSFINHDMADGRYLHMLGFGDGHSGKSNLGIIAGDCRDINYGTLIRGNKLKETCFIYIFCGDDDTIRDFIIQDNSIDGAEEAIIVDGKTNKMLLSGNKFTNCRKAYNIDAKADYILR